MCWSIAMGLYPPRSCTSRNGLSPSFNWGQRISRLKNEMTHSSFVQFLKILRPYNLLELFLHENVAKSLWKCSQSSWVNVINFIFLSKTWFNFFSPLATWLGQWAKLHIQNVQRWMVSCDEHLNKSSSRITIWGWRWLVGKDLNAKSNLWRGGF